MGEKAMRGKGVEPVSSLDELLPTCEIVSVHVPLTEETRGLLGARELGLMRRGSVLVQAARGGVVDEGALVEALRDGPLAGAGIDVFEEEPPPADHSIFSVKNAVLSLPAGAPWQTVNPSFANAGER